MQDAGGGAKVSFQIGWKVRGGDWFRVVVIGPSGPA